MSSEDSETGKRRRVGEIGAASHKPAELSQEEYVTQLQAEKVGQGHSCTILCKRKNIVRIGSDFRKSLVRSNDDHLSMISYSSKGGPICRATCPSLLRTADLWHFVDTSE